jgi:excisionase family DNA binding protein
MDHDVFLSVREAAALTRLSPWTLRKWLSDGKLQGCKIGDRRLVRKSELLKLVIDDQPKSRKK